MVFFVLFPQGHMRASQYVDVQSGHDMIFFFCLDWQIDKISTHNHGHPVEQWCHPKCKSQYSLPIYWEHMANKEL